MRHYLFYIPSFRGGGAQRIAAMLASQFSQNGEKVSFVVNNTEGPHKALLAKDISLYEMKPQSKFKAIILFSSLLKRLKPDGIYCWGGLCNIIGPAGAALAGCSDNIVISYRNFFDAEEKIGGKATFFLAPLLVYMSKKTVCISRDLQVELRTKFKVNSKKLLVIKNPIDLKEIRKKNIDRVSDEVLKQYINSKPFLLSAGRLVEHKDFSTLLQAFHCIHKFIPHNLVILGKGPLENKLKAMIKELHLTSRVIMPGFMQNPFPVFRAASLFVLASVSEGFGNVLVEALASGTPVVSTDCPGGPKEILMNGKYGMLVPVKNVNKLAQAIMHTLKNPINPDVLQRRAADFALDKIALQYRAIFEDY
jgi:glycosyltransferase involved in cell wall biosynthesis